MLKAKKAAYEQEVYSYEKSVLTAFKDARNAIVDFSKIKEIYESASTTGNKRHEVM